MKILELYNQKTTFTGQPMKATLYGPEIGPSRAIVILIHGMAEYSDRYLPFANELIAHGFAIVLFDLPGHGEAARQAGRLGHFADVAGGAKVEADVRALIEYFHRKYSQVPFVLMGHSMGSMITRRIMQADPIGFKKCILSGTMGKQAGHGMGKVVASLWASFKGPAVPSPLLDSLLASQYGEHKENNAWLSRDVAEVAKYNASPLCGFPFTTRAMADMLGWAAQISTNKAFSKMNKGTKYLLVAGTADPIGQNGAGVRYVADKLAAARCDVTCVLFPEARHEVMNEINRDEVVATIISFLEDKPVTPQEVDHDDRDD